jgi:hypothetical protein
VPTDPDNRTGENFLLEEEDSLEQFVPDANSDEVAEQMRHFAEDDGTQEVE